jgi:DNA-binding transcriptional LysR family regulator
MDPFDGLSDFLAVAETGSFTDAARRLETSKATVSDRVARLEKRLGVRLFERTSRRVRLTDAGVAFHAKLSGIGEVVAEAERDALELHRKPRGTLRVTMAWGFAWQRVAPLLPEFLERYPDLSVDLDADNGVVDLVKAGFDLAIRGTTHTPPGMIARRLTSHQAIVVAAPSYLERRGRPRTPKDLEAHPFAIFEDLPSGRRLLPLRRGNTEVRVALHGTLSSNSVEVLQAAVLGGYGLGIVLDFNATADLEAGRLEHVLPEWRFQEIVMQAVYPQNKQIAAKVKAFVDFLAKRL